MAAVCLLAVSEPRCGVCQSVVVLSSADHKDSSELSTRRRPYIELCGGKGAGGWGWGWVCSVREVVVEASLQDGCVEWGGDGGAPVANGFLRLV